MPDLVLYDGVCGLCNRTNQFILKRDRADRFRFASLQSELAKQLLARHGYVADALDTVYVVADWQGPAEAVFSKAGAALFVLRALGGIWTLASVLGLLPLAWQNALYTFVASRRYRWFGRYDTCPIPPAEQRAKFVD